MIAKDHMPLRTPERLGFQAFVKKLQPLYRIPCESTLTKMIEMKYEELRERYGVILSKSDSICLTTDIWTHGSTMKSYLLFSHKVRREIIFVRKFSIQGVLMRRSRNNFYFCCHTFVFCFRNRDNVS